MNWTFLDIMAELLFLLLELSLEDLVSFPDWLDHEQPLDLLEGNTAGFGDEEEGEYEGKERQGSEEHIHAVTHGSKHLLSESRHQEVEEPVACRRGSLSQRTEVGVEEFLENFR